MDVPATGPLLAFDTSTEALSAGIAWTDARGQRQELLHAGQGGKAASAALIPLLLSLVRRAGFEMTDLRAIVFGRGPGSFTGLRTACAVAQGLACGAGVAVLPVETLLAVAQDARGCTGARQVYAVLDARMGQAYAAAYAWTAERGWERGGDIVLGEPAQLQVPAGHDVAGNLALAGRPWTAAAPTAAALLQLAPALLARGNAVDAEHALPLYVRNKVAQTTAERDAARALAAATQELP